MGVYQRTSIGIRETVNIYATAAVSWTVFGPDDEYFESTGSQISFTAGWTEGSYTVLAEKNDCERELTFNAVAPTGIRGDRRVGRERHVSGTPSAGLAFCVTVLPESVSFSGLLISEGELADANTRTGVFADDLFDGQLGHARWEIAVMSNNKLPGIYDFSYFGLPASTWAFFDGTFNQDSTLELVLPWSYVDLAEPTVPVDIFIQNVISRTVLKPSGTVVKTKFGQSVTFGLNSPDRNATGFPQSAAADCDPSQQSEPGECAP